MSSDFLSFVPLYPLESVATVLARMEDWANEGVDPLDDRWVDTREGTFWRIAITGPAEEIARLYDLAGTEVPASVIPFSSWGEYLDELAAVPSLERLAATAAEGIVRFTGTNGSSVVAGTQVGVEPADPDADAPTFEVITGGVIAGGFVDLLVRAVEQGSVGNVPAGAVTEEGTPVTGITARTNSAPITGGTDAETDEALVERLVGAYAGKGGGRVYDYIRWARSIAGVGRVTVIAEAFGPGTVHVILSTPDGSPVAQSVIDAAQQFLDPPAAATVLTSAVTLPAATVSVGSTAGFRSGTNVFRLGGSLVTYTGITATSFTGCSGGSGSHAIGVAVTQSGRGGGEAPIGHHVLVSTAAVVNLTLGGTIEFEQGYSLDGTGGTIALLTAIELSVANYVNSIEPGGEVVRARIVGKVTDVAGVHDVGDVTINGASANLAISADPAQVPRVSVWGFVGGSLP